MHVGAPGSVSILFQHIDSPHSPSVYRIAGRLLTNVPRSIARGTRHLRPIIEERFRLMEEYGDNEWTDKPVRLCVRVYVLGWWFFLVVCVVILGSGVRAC